MDNCADNEKRKFFKTSEEKKPIVNQYESLPEPNKETSDNTSARWRRSEGLVVTIAFIAQYIDATFKIGMVPLLPVLVARIHGIDYGLWHEVSRVLFDGHTDDKPVFDNSSETRVSDNNFTDIDLRELIRSEAVIATMIMPIAEMFSSVIAGICVEKFGTVKPMLTGTGLSAITSILVPYAPHVYALYALRVSSGIGCTFCVVPSLTMISCKFADDQKRSGAISTSYFGSICGSLSVPLLLLTYQYLIPEAPFILVTILCCLCALLCFAVVIETNSDAGKEQNDTESVLATVTHCKDGFLFLLCLLASGCTASGLIHGALLTEWLLKDLNAQLWQVSIVYFLSALGSVGSVLTIKIVLLKRFRKGCLICIGFAGLSATSVIIPLLDRVWLVIAPEVIYRVFVQMLWVCIPVVCGILVTTEPHKGRHGTLFGYLQASLNGGRFFGGFLAAYVVSKVQFTGMMFIAAGIAAMCSLPSLFLRKLEEESIR